MKYTLLIITFLISTILFSCSNEKTYTQYIPLRLIGDTLVKEEKLYTKEHFDNIEYVLNFYEVRYIRNGKTAIKFKQPLNKELMWNYSTKSENKQWLKWNGPKNK